jgi:hypothetical protein
MMGLARHVECKGAVRSVYQILVREAERKRSLGRPRHRMGDNIRMDLGKMG